MNIANLLHDVGTTIDRFHINFDCFSTGQLESKQWAVDELAKLNVNLETVFILCGWYGLMATMMLNRDDLTLDKIRSFDIDDTCWQIADHMNRSHVIDGWKFKAATEDINNINFKGHNYSAWSNMKKEFVDIYDEPRTIINTSCEHTDPSWFNNVVPGQLCVLQSNDYYQGEGHVNCVSQTWYLKEMFPLSVEMYSGIKRFEKYNRFMVIGVK